MGSRTGIRVSSLPGLRSVFGENKQALRSVAALSGGNILSTLLGAVGGLLVARFLGPDETGLFRSYTIPMMYLTFLHLGTFDGLTRQIPYYMGKNMPEKVEALASSAGAWNVLISIVLSVGFGICALYSAWQKDWNGVLGWSSQMFYCWAILYAGYVSATYRTLNHFVSLARIQLVQAVVNFLGVFVLPVLRFPGLCLRSVASSVAGVWLFHRERPIKTKYHFSRQPFLEVLKLGFPLTFWGSLYTSVWTASESLLALSLAGVSALGLFSVAVILREAISVVPQAVNQVMNPRVVESFARSGSLRKANTTSVWVTAILTAGMVVVALVSSFLLDYFVPLAIPKYVEGVPLMKICLWFGVVQAAGLPLNTLFATGRPWLLGRGVIPGLIVFPISVYLLVPVLGGVNAVAAGSLIGKIVRTIAGYIDIFYLTRREHAALVNG